MINRDGKWLQFACEDCPATTDEYDDFKECLEDAKRGLWEIRPSAEGYTHRCPDCSLKSNLARQRKLFSQ